jgi:hypothetical protein
MLTLWLFPVVAIGVPDWAMLVLWVLPEDAVAAPEPELAKVLLTGLLEFPQPMAQLSTPPAAIAAIVRARPGASSRITEAPGIERMQVVMASITLAT